MIRPVRTIPPVDLPVSLGDLKSAARVDFDEDDAELDAYLAAAVDHMDGYAGILGRCLMSQTWVQGFADWCDRLRLPFPDVTSVVITYADLDGVERTVEPALYEIFEGPRGAEILFRDAFTTPSVDDDMAAPVSVTFVAGYGSAGDVPQDIRLAILALARHWYDGQEGDPPQLALITKYRFALP